MQNIRYDNYVTSCNILASPLLNNMSNTDIPIDRDEEGNIIIPSIEGVTVEDLIDYVKFCNTGTILPSDRFNLDLYSYMGHRIREDDIEYTKVRLMEIWYSNITSSDGLNGLYTEDKTPLNPIGLIYIFVKGLDYSYIHESDKHWTFNIMNSNDMKIYFERYYEYESQGILEMDVDCYIEEPLMEFIGDRRDIVNILRDNDVPITEKIELLQSIQATEKDILSLIAYNKITIGEASYDVVFMSTLSEFSHKYLWNPTNSVLVYKNKIYRSPTVEYLYENCFKYAKYVYSDCAIVTDLYDKSIIEWDEPIPRVLANGGEFYDIPCKMELKDNVLHVKFPDVVFDIIEREMFSEKDKKYIRRLDRLHQGLGNDLTKYQKAIILSYQAEECNKIIVYKDIESDDEED